MCFLWIRWSDFTIIFSPDVSFTYLLLVYLVIAKKNASKARFCIYFFISMFMRKERPARVFIG